ncbi:hypothetical protein M23134_06556 [Microscilla marina ATCC 23134]|uniref:Uncharacterized protein n=1 Tax=Microscilla marina ATCC 23134 TaxID=313606 RepID=A1ZQU1_MICM2|nr:hypothetical protein M23134_06556 [Microscilla marina ATCC 23134]
MFLQKINYKSPVQVYLNWALFTRCILLTQWKLQASSMMGTSYAALNLHQWGEKSGF